MRTSWSTTAWNKVPYFGTSTCLDPLNSSRFFLIKLAILRSIFRNYNDIIYKYHIFCPRKMGYPNTLWWFLKIELANHERQQPQSGHVWTHPRSIWSSSMSRNVWIKISSAFSAMRFSSSHVSWSMENDGESGLQRFFSFSLHQSTFFPVE